MMRTYYNNNQNLNQWINQETVFHHLSKKYQFLLNSTFFWNYCCCTFFCIFSRWLFFPSKHIKIMFKAFKLILNINVEGKVCSHHIVQFCQTERKPIRYCKFISSKYNYEKRSLFYKVFLTLLTHQHHLVEFYLTMAKMALEIFQVITCSLGVTYNANIRLMLNMVVSLAV